MRKLNIKRLTILILLSIFIIIEIIAFDLSRAKNIKEVTLNVADRQGLLEMQISLLNAIDDGESGYYIILPGVVNTKYVSSYLVKEKSITNEIETSNENVTDTETDSIVIEEVPEDEPQENLVELLPGDRLYLTEEELDNLNVEINAVYNSKEKNEQLLYYTNLEKVIGNNIIEVKGYMPLNSEIEELEITAEQIGLIEGLAKSTIGENTILDSIVNIKIATNEIEYNNMEYEENFKITISEFDEKNILGNCKIAKIITGEETQINVLEDIEIVDNKIDFYTDKLDMFIIALDAEQFVNPFELAAMLNFNEINEGDVWDESIASEFKYGEGTSNKPYLITTGSELAYLASLVNSGNSYEETYFQLANEINLNNLNWIPIGTYSNSFRGIFDGAGHTISNVSITIAGALPERNVIMSYGVFGSIGGSDYSSSEIKNVEFKNININITSTGSLAADRGYHIGLVTGTVFNNGKIANCIVKNSNILETGTIIPGNISAIVHMGGIAGSAVDEGNGNPYIIENCYVSANINTNIESVIGYSGEISAGGIVGRIDSHNVWPEKCLYSGTISTHSSATTGGFIGPIFGSLRGVSARNTLNGYSSYENYFNGNDATGTNLEITSYYTNYIAKSTEFTTNEITGISNNSSRINTSSTNMGYYQGVNKGIYTTDINQMFIMFNEYAGTEYVSWKIENNNLAFNHKLHASLVQSQQRNSFVIDIHNEYNTNNYTYEWYINNELNLGITENNYSLPVVTLEDYDFSVLINDGKYYSVVKFFVEGMEKPDIVFIRNGDKLTAELMGEMLQYTKDFAYQWYKQDELLVGENLEELNNIDDNFTYRLRITHNTAPDIVMENTYESVYINDLESDWNYYCGLNYVNSDDGTLPSGENQNIYNESNLAKVIISYSGTEVLNNVIRTGTVSIDEQQSEYVYRKYYPVINGKVKIELIDNPFTNRPVGKGFNNWVLYDGNGIISFDSELYKRYIEVDVLSENAKPQDINISLHATWVDAAVSKKTASNSWSDVFSVLNNKGVQLLNPSDEYENQSMAGYYIKNGTDYHLIQSDDQNRIYNSNNNYYYMATRDTNIVYLTGNINNTWSSNQDKPFTFTGIYGGVKYSDTCTWTITNINVQTYNDTTIENLKVASDRGIAVGNTNNVSPPSNNTTNRYIYGNFKNLKVGRGIVSNNINNCAFEGIVGGNTGRTGSATSVTKYNLTVESGTYIFIVLTNSANISELYVDLSAIYGSDYDRVKNNNESLDVRFVATGNWGGNIRGINNYYSGQNLTVKSGSFGTGKGDHTSGIYVGGRGGGNYNFARSAKIEGGYIYNLIGGPISHSTREELNDIYMYITGGTIDFVVGGAGTSPTYGNRILSLTGGTINYSVFGGSNSYNGASSDGTLNGASLVYVGGNIQVGNPEYVLNNNTLWNAEAGSVFGIGNGQSGYTNLGSNDNSNIIIDGNAHILRNVYGGGNYGAVGVVSSKPTTQTNIKILDGVVEGDIYGGGNRNGSGSASKISTVNITMSGGDVSGSIYGGSNITGTIHGSTNVNILSGNVNTNVYGGGKGGGSGTTGTFVSQNVKVEIGNSFSGPNINNNVYGGSAYGVVNGAARNNTVTQYTTSVNIQNGDIAQSVFGGGQGDGNINNTPYVNGNIIVTVNNGDINHVYGGNDQSGIPNGSAVVYLNGGTIGESYGGGNNAAVNNSQIYLQGSYVGSIYGGSNISGNIQTSNVTSTSGNAENIFGGNNLGGITQTSNVNINGGTIGNAYAGGNKAVVNNPKIEVNNGTVGTVYGGGNEANVPLTNVDIKGGTIDNVYGGGNAAGVGSNTRLNIINGNILKNVYGGGQEGIVTGSTNVDISDSSVKGSLYAGGNGVTAIVFGNTNLNMHGETIIGTEDSKTPISGCVFGGGNAAATGTSGVDNSLSKVNITGGTIFGNIYGGANTSVVYGNTDVKIGYDAVGNNDLKKSDIYVKGTIFGGGEANASGSENYDFSFISVTKGINIDITGTGHTSFITEGSIFGSGNASSTSGESYITIKDFGTFENPQRNISIQRATTVTLYNSAIALQGATDRTNEYSNEYFTISRVNELKLKNNSALYLNYGANLLRKLSSLVDIDNVERKSAVIIDENTNNTVKNVDNRIYLREGRNLNIATNEQVTTYGEVDGMMFLGLFTNITNPNTTSGLYSYEYDNGEEIINEGVFSANSYVLGLHEVNHDTSVDGFYSNYDDNGYIKNKYVETTPEDDLYYIWTVGEIFDVTVFEITLTASKYSTLGTAELPLTGFSTANTKFLLTGFTTGLIPGISFVDKNEISSIADTGNIADTIFGLSMKAGKNSWQTDSVTQFYTEDNGSYSGSTTYTRDNSTFTPALNFCLYHSANIETAHNLGEVKIRLQVLTPINDLNYKISYIDVNITLLTELYQDYFYEAAISPGEEFDLFPTMETNMTDNSKFSVYYSLYIDDFSNSTYSSDYFDYSRELVSLNSSNMGYPFPKDTKITMIDKVINKYYYYVVSEQDYLSNKYVYKLSDFIGMGSNNHLFDEQSANLEYYNNSQDIVYENFIFHVDFKESDISQNIFDNKLLMQLQEQSDETVIGVLGIHRDTTKYSVYKNSDAVIDVSSQAVPESIYLGNDFNLNVITNFRQNIIDTKLVYDTKYFDEKMGLQISIFDNNGNQLNVNDLLGVTFSLDGRLYYPRIDGILRINTSENVSNVLSRINIDTKNNTELATGNYTMKIESFGSPDGICYGRQETQKTESTIYIINGTYGLKVETDENSKIINKNTGQTLNGNNSLELSLSYLSQLADPKLTVSLERRDYETQYSMKYEKVDLQEYVSDILSATDYEYEYELENNLSENSTVLLTMKDNLVTGTYKITVKLYDQDTYIGETYEYIIIK